MDFKNQCWDYSNDYNGYFYLLGGNRYSRLRVFLHDRGYFCLFLHRSLTWYLFLWNKIGPKVHRGSLKSHASLTPVSCHSKQEFMSQSSALLSLVRTETAENVRVETQRQPIHLPGVNHGTCRRKQIWGLKWNKWTEHLTSSWILRGLWTSLNKMLTLWWRIIISTDCSAGSHGCRRPSLKSQITLNLKCIEGHKSLGATLGTWSTSWGKWITGYMCFPGRHRPRPPGIARPQNSLILFNIRYWIFHDWLHFSHEVSRALPCWYDSSNEKEQEVWEESKSILVEKRRQNDPWLIVTWSSHHYREFKFICYLI